MESNHVTPDEFKTLDYGGSWPLTDGNPFLDFCCTFQAPKRVVIGRPQGRLAGFAGFLYWSLFIMIFVVYLCWSSIIVGNNHLKYEAPMGSPRIALRRPTIFVPELGHRCSPQNRSCVNNFTDVTTLPYCLRCTEGDACHYEGEKNECRIWDEDSVVARNLGKDMVFATHIREWSQNRICEGRDHHHTCPKTFESTERASYYLADVDNFVLTISHSMRTPAIITEVDMKMHGTGLQSCPHVASPDPDAEEEAVEDDSDDDEHEAHAHRRMQHDEGESHDSHEHGSEHGGSGSDGAHHDGDGDSSGHHHHGDGDSSEHHHDGDGDSSGHHHHSDEDSGEHHHDGDADSGGHHHHGDGDSGEHHHDGDADSGGHHHHGDGDSGGEEHEDGGASGGSASRSERLRAHANRFRAAALAAMAAPKCNHLMPDHTLSTLNDHHADHFRLGDVLKAAGVSLDEASPAQNASAGQTRRNTGTTLILTIHYANTKPYESFYKAYLGDMPIRYHYSLTEMPVREYKLRDSFWTGPWNGEDRTVVEAHGIHLQIMFSGELGTWSWAQFMVLLSVSMTTVFMAEKIVVLFIRKMPLLPKFLKKPDGGVSQSMLADNMVEFFKHIDQSWAKMKDEQVDTARKKLAPKE